MSESWQRSVTVKACSWTRVYTDMKSAHEGTRQGASQRKSARARASECAHTLLRAYHSCSSWQASSTDKTSSKLIVATPYALRLCA